MTQFLTAKINERIKADSLRELKITDRNLIDFSSNDYLGFAKSNQLKQQFRDAINNNFDLNLGATGSRLISGNNNLFEYLESYLAEINKVEAGLIFNSGYDANIGLLTAIANRNDTYICDELIHASLIDGIRLSKANKFTFKHNDLKSLEEKLKLAKGNIFVVTESVFSMDGDLAPLEQIVKLIHKYNAYLIVDEAHAIGVMGNGGEGLIQSLGLQNQIFAKIVTFGKAIGSHGAVVLGSNILKTYLFNFARSFIYTTALPDHNLLTIKNAFKYLQIAEEVKALRQNIEYFNCKIVSQKNYFIPSNSAIQSLIIEGNTQCKNLASKIRLNGFDVKAILSPTVSLGKERIRICLHAYNTKSEIDHLINLLHE